MKGRQIMKYAIGYYTYGEKESFVITHVVTTNETALHTTNLLNKFCKEEKIDQMYRFFPMYRLETFEIPVIYEED